MGKKSKKKKQESISEIKPRSKNATLLGSLPPWTVAIGLIIICLLIYYWPLMVENKTMLSSDSMNSRAYQPFIKQALANGSYPLWNPYVFGGMPSFGSLSAAPYIDVVNFIFVNITSIITGDAYHFLRLFLNYLLLGSGIFLLLRSKGIRMEPALFSSLAFLFIPQVVSFAAFGHNTKLGAISLLPYIFLFFDRLLERRNLLYFSLTGLFIGLQFLRNHVQMTFYTLLFIGIYFIFWIVSTYRNHKNVIPILKGAGLFIGAVVLGALVSTVVNLSVWEYTHYSIRGASEGGLTFDYATSWSFPPADIATFFNPSFMGFGGQSYWGTMTSTAYPLYFGIVVLLLASLAFVLNRTSLVWFLGVISGLSLLISFGNYFPILYGPMFKLVPFFDKFRVPKMIHVLLSFSMVFLAGISLDAIIKLSKQEFDQKRRWILRMIGVLSALVLLFLLLLLFGKSTYMGWASRAGQLKEAVYDKAVEDGVKTLFFFVIAAGVIWMALRNKISRTVLPYILLVLVLIDFWGIGKKMNEPQLKTVESTFYRETPDVSYLKAQKKPFRIITVADQRSGNWYSYHLIQNVYGYSAAKLQIYQELMEAFQMPERYVLKYLTPDQRQLKTIENVDTTAKKIHDNFLKIMNVEYMLSPVPLPDTSWQMVQAPQTRNGQGVFQFKDALPRLFFPKSILQAKGKEGILNYMTSDRFDPTVTGIIEEEAPFEIQPSDNNRAQIVEYDNHHIHIEADIKSRCMMALSEIYYPAGWKAFVNGQETKIYKTDYVLRAIFLEPGQHQIEFDFAPQTFKTGFGISLVALLLLTLGVAAGFYIEKRKS
ncbi:YfhO family protein [bacterium]